METKFLKQSKINFSKEVNNYYPILTDEALNLLLLFMKI
jgi:malate synthase